MIIADLGALLGRIPGRVYSNPLNNDVERADEVGMQGPGRELAVRAEHFRRYGILGAPENRTGEFPVVPMTHEEAQLLLK